MSTDLMRRLADPASRPDPYPVLARLRDARISQLTDGGYVLGRYRDVVGLLHDPRISSDPHHATDPGTAIVIDNAPFIQRDPPDHDRLRSVANRYFGPPTSPGVVSGKEPGITAFVHGLIDALPASGEADLVDQYAFPLPVTVICGLLGVPAQDAPQFHAWTEGIVAGLDAAERADPAALVKRREESQAAMLGYVTELVGRHRAHPGESMLSQLANDRAADAMTDADLVGTSFLLLIAGHETTVNLTANGILTLLRHPWALDRLRAEPAWVVPLVEELLRFEPPVQYLPNRVALADIEVDGTTIPKGSRVILLLAAANRDPDWFARPDRFEPGRLAPRDGGERRSSDGDAPHVGFGSGVHYCFGAPLARIEAQAALSAFASRFVNPRLVSDPPPYRESPVLRGPLHLPVSYDAVAPG